MCFSILQNCDGKMYDQSLSDQFHFEVTRSTSYGYIEQLTLKNDHVFDVNQLMLKVNPIVCYTGTVAYFTILIWAATRVFQQCGILTCVDSDEPV